jgi:hypothetical protein
MAGGLTTRKNSETCWLGRRGKPEIRSKGVRELIVAPVREHSRKPDELYRRIERFCLAQGLSCSRARPAMVGPLGATRRLNSSGGGRRVMSPDHPRIARTLGGQAMGHVVLAPGPSHSPKDRSLSVRLSANAPDGSRPVWALGSKHTIGNFAVLSGVEALTILVEPDAVAEVEACASRWHAAGREVFINRAVGGKDLDDAVRRAS